jgi:prolyl oligopeptidase
VSTSVRAAFRKHFAFALVATTVPAAAAAFPARAQTSANSAPQVRVSEQPDKYTWLEDVHGEKPLAWVKAENARTAAVLEKNPHFATLDAEALKVLDSPDRLPAPEFHNGVVYNTWRDASHLRGIVRRTSLKDYLNADPKWETVIDYDALSKSDNQSWVGEGLACLAPLNELCLVSLSAGGEDAQTLREFDLRAGKFVDGGFVMSRGKQYGSWVDKDTLLIGRDFGAGTMSDSGYPITARVWKRGQPLESAKEIFRGETKDTSVTGYVVMDGQGHRAEIIQRSVNIFESENYIVLPDGPKKLSLPLKSTVQDMLGGQLLVKLEENWKPEGAAETIPQGSLVALDLAAVEKDPVHLKPVVIFSPTSQEFEQYFATTENHIIVSTLDHVQTRAYIYTLAGNGGESGSGGTWARSSLPVPANLTIDSLATSATNDSFFFGMEGFLTPPSLFLGDASKGTLEPAKSQKPQFDATGLVVEQLDATSKDGTKIPYFIVHRKDMPMSGANPTLLTAYGGFQVSLTPFYWPVMGKLWLERGGVFVQANIRGGGEFGPAWHEAGLKTHRQLIYDDFFAVGQNLVSRKITSPSRLGILGGSNGGLLMGVEFTQHPEAWKAVIIQIPLLDMLSYEHLSAGASWVGEYGSVTVPEERAFLASISPYNQLKPDVKYPEPLILTTTADDRVGPVHARKFAARLEEFHKPFLYDEITEGGHGEGADHKQDARTEAVYFTYLMMKLMDAPTP